MRATSTKAGPPLLSASPSPRTLTCSPYLGVKRLRSVLLCAYQLSEDIKPPAGITGDLCDDYMKGLRIEPCVIERDQELQEIMEAPHKLRKGMAPR